jgi:glutaminase
VITGSAGPDAGKGAVPARSSRGSGQPVSLTGTEAVYRQLFDSFDRDRDDKVSQWAVLSRLQGCGLLPDDPRIQEALAGLRATEGASKQISFGQFKALAKHNSSLIQRAVEGNLAVPDFPALSSDIERMYGELLPVRSGSVADYIPQLRRVDPDQLAIAVCTVDGQRFSAGDARTAFCLQSVSKTVSYCLALDEHGPEAVHKHVGREPSGRSFNELALNPKGLPHNPMVNAGAIMTSSLIRPDLDIADRFDLVAATWARLAGGRRVGFNNAVYLSERQTADRNFALGCHAARFRLTASRYVRLPQFRASLMSGDVWLGLVKSGALVLGLVLVCRAFPVG